MDLAAQKHFMDRLSAAELRTEPFPHFYCEQVFEPAFYQRLLQALPPDADYEMMAPPYESRLHIELTPTSAAKIGAFWTQFEAWLHSQSLMDAMTGKFAGRLADMGAFRAEQIRSNLCDDGALKVHGRSMLARDFANYAIGPHTDSPAKFVVGIFYLSKDDRMQRFGTSIYRPKDDADRGWRTAHLPSEGFELVQTFPNRPNSLFCFMKTDNSFHGVEAGDYPDGGRDVLFWLPEIGGRHRSRPLSLPRAMFDAP